MQTPAKRATERSVERTKKWTKICSGTLNYAERIAFLCFQFTRVCVVFLFAFAIHSYSLCMDSLCASVFACVYYYVIVMFKRFEWSMQMHTLWFWLNTYWCIWRYLLFFFCFCLSALHVHIQSVFSFDYALQIFEFAWIFHVSSVLHCINLRKKNTNWTLNASNRNQLLAHKRSRWQKPTTLRYPPAARTCIFMHSCHAMPCHATPSHIHFVSVSDESVGMQKQNSTRASLFSDLWH